MVKHAVILAGGSGTRLWPASLNACPKQFLALGRDYTLFQQTLLRTIGLGIEGDIIIVANKAYTGQLQEQIGSCVDSLSGNGQTSPALSCKLPRRIVILPEPLAKNTAPALVYACMYLQRQGEAASSLLVLASDHYIEPPAAFRTDVEQAARLADEGYMVSFGIPPRGPETGYGYIEAGPALAAGGYKIKLFHEKPDLKKAKAYIRKKNFYWNSGLFCFKAATLLTQVAQHTPQVVEPFQAWAGQPPESSTTENRPVSRLLTPTLPLVTESVAAVQAVFEQVPSISIDYAVMEKTASSAMVAAHFQWSDVGSWDEVSLLSLPAGADTGQPHFQYNAENCFIHADIPVAVAGVKDLIVIVKNGRVLICPKGNSQLVSKLVKDMRDKGRDELI